MKHEVIRNIVLGATLTAGAFGLGFKMGHHLSPEISDETTLPSREYVTPTPISEYTSPPQTVYSVTPEPTPIFYAHFLPRRDDEHKAEVPSRKATAGRIGLPYPPSSVTSSLAHDIIASGAVSCPERVTSGARFSPHEDYEKNLDGCYRFFGFSTEMIAVFERNSRITHESLSSYRYIIPKETVFTMR